MWVADAHVDALMWNRDLNERSGRGHVDFPRLREAGVGLQCFTVVTEGLPWIDGFGAFAWWHRYPRKARQGRWARGVFQMERMAEFCAASRGQARLVRTPADLTEARAGGQLAAVLGVEGGQALEGRPERVAELAARGVQFMGLTHLRDNDLGGTSHRSGKGTGLTPLGRQVLDQMVEHHMAVDLAHASRQLLSDLLADRRPAIFCSHTGMSAITRSWRNLSDEVLRGIADRGGVVGVIFSTIFLGGGTMEDLVRHIEHALNVVGEDGVALGSDFDGMVPLPKGMHDVTSMPLVIQALQIRGHLARVVEKIVGENLYRFFQQVLRGR